MGLIAQRHLRVKKVLIVDGSALSRVLIESILTASNDFSVVGAINSSEQFAAAVADLRPDLVIVDLYAPYIDGPRILSTLSEYRAMKRVILSPGPVIHSVNERLMELGANAFLDKKKIAEDHEEFRAQLRQLFEDRTATLISEETIEEAGYASTALSVVGAVGAVAVAGPLMPVSQVQLPASIGCGSPMISPVDVLLGDEVSRVRCLHELQIANDDCDPRLDRITRHLRRVTGFPIAAVTLIDDDVQWTKSSSGLELARTSRAQAICAHTIAHSSPLVVTDMREHPIFSSFDVVVGAPHIRSYVGVPLVVEQDLAIGAVCLMDYQPRTTVQREIAILSDMADLVAEILYYGRPKLAA